MVRFVAGSSDEVLLESLRQWNQGEQQPAISTVRALADEEDPAALLLICFFFQALGQPNEALPFAKKASTLGNQFILSNFFAPLADNRETRDLAAELVRSSPTGGFVSNDPIGRALEFVQQGDELQGLEMLRAAAGPHPWPQDQDVETARARFQELGSALAEVTQTKINAVAGIENASAEADEIAQSFRTRQQTLTKLLDNLTSASSQSYFDRQANKYEKETRRAWGIGVGVLVLAATAAFLPLVLNYASKSHMLHGQSNVSAHLGAAIALATVAGVILARARSRDRDRQRNVDLSVALGTMFAYSEQIANDEEKERFKHDMGRLVLETFLRQKPPSEDGRRNILGEIIDTSGSGKAPNLPGA